MSYHFDVLAYLKAKGLRSFTHQDIKRATVGNCSYSILRDLRRELIKDGLNLDETFETNTKEVYDDLKKKFKKVTKRYKRYFIIEKEKTA